MYIDRQREEERERARARINMHIHPNKSIDIHAYVCKHTLDVITPAQDARSHRDQHRRVLDNDVLLSAVAGHARIVPV